MELGSKGRKPANLTWGNIPGNKVGGAGVDKKVTGVEEPGKCGDLP